MQWLYRRYGGQQMYVQHKSRSPPSSEVGEVTDERDWKKYHTPKNLSLSIAIELAELFELFQWKTDEEIFNELASEQYKNNLSDELADVAIYLLALSEILGINLEEAIINKLQKNKKKYPK
ncbi:MAG: nucleotide pyrophosphohydrolase [Candidatus Heimdallarchaeaceae archaeon]